MKQQVINQLEEMGVYLHEGGFVYDSFGAMFDSLPLVDIYADSEEPTAQEIKKLAEFVKNKAKFYFSSAVKDFKVEGANTVTFNKKMVNGIIAA